MACQERRRARRCDPLQPPPSTRAPHRSAKARGKEPEALSVTISADEFELVMGILERLTDERYPCLHAVSPTVSLCRSLADLSQDVSVFPTITEFEPTFANRLPASFFPNYRVPDYIPQPPQLLHVLHVIYPHWCKRRLEREGRRIIPQINSNETNEGDPDVCFRHRDAKPVRKTRRTDTGTINRMQSLQNNIRQLQHIVQHVLRRELLKQGRAIEERQVMNHRMQLSEVKRKFPTTPFGMRDDDDCETPSIRDYQHPPPFATSPIPYRHCRCWPSGPTEMPHPRAVALANRKNVDEFMQRNPQQERWWDDLTDTTHMPLPPPAPPERQLRGVRLRIGRGGRRRVDRRPVSVVNGAGRSEISRLESLFAPANGEGGSAGGIVVLKLKSETDDEFERAIVTSERWKYNQDERLEDDFADRFILSRLTRYSIEDYELLAGDQSIMQHLVPAHGRASTSVLALDAARQRQLELERNPPKPSPTLTTPAITPTTNGTPANPSPEPGAAAPVIGASTSPSPAPSLLPNPVTTPTHTYQFYSFLDRWDWNRSRTHFADELLKLLVPICIYCSAVKTKVAAKQTTSSFNLYTCRYGISTDCNNGVHTCKYKRKRERSVAFGCVERFVVIDTNLIQHLSKQANVPVPHPDSIILAVVSPFPVLKRIAESELIEYKLISGKLAEVEIADVQHVDSLVGRIKTSSASYVIDRTTI
ncbi:Enhancer of polycomb-like protein 1, partial [Ceratobasidium sp. 414]